MLTAPEGQERDRSSAGAWAAAAVVLAVGALIFAVLAHARIADLEGRVADLEADAKVTPPTVAPTVPSTIETTTEVPTQPPDVAGAKNDVIAAFTAVYSAPSPLDTRLKFIDDPSGVGDAIHQVEQGSNAVFITAGTVNVNDVQFASPTRAAVTYAINLPGQPPILGRTGEARVTGGTWKVVRATVCADLGAVGGTCA